MRILNNNTLRSLSINLPKCQPFQRNGQVSIIVSRSLNTFRNNHSLSSTIKGDSSRNYSTLSLTAYSFLAIGGSLMLNKERHLKDFQRPQD